MKQLFVGMIVALMLAGCSSVNVSNEMPEAVAGKLDAEYRIGVRDQLQISVWKNADLSIAVPVRPDGMVSVPLVGDVLAAGRTSTELASEVAKGLESYIRNPQVTVIITNPASADYLQRVRITGAVGSPQSLAYQQGMTVLDVLLQAGGVSAFGVPNGALLYRQTSEGLKVYPVRLDDILKDGNLQTNYELAPSDIITVPERTF